MSRWVSASNETAAGETRVMMVTMVDLDIPGDRLRLHDGVGTITWDGNDWLGVGQYGSINTISESTEVIAAPVEMTLSGVDSALITDAMTTVYHGQTVAVYVAMFNPDTDTMVDDPDLIWEGLLDTMTIEVGEKTAQIRVKCEHRLRRMPSTSRYTDEDQQGLYSGDKFFSRLHQIPQYRSRWGEQDVTFMGFPLGAAVSEMLRRVAARG